MKLKLKINAKSIFRYIYILIIIINIGLIIKVYQFTDKYLYSTLILDRQALLSAINKDSDDINIKKFEDVIGKIEKKTNQSAPLNLSNPFD